MLPEADVNQPADEYILISKMTGYKVWKLMQGKEELIEVIKMRRS